MKNKPLEEQEAKIIDAKIERGLAQARAGGGTPVEEYLKELYALRDKKTNDK